MNRLKGVSLFANVGIAETYLKNVGIDIDEILRAKWLQFDKYYVEEFGLDGVPKEQEYVYDFFNNFIFYCH